MTSQIVLTLMLACHQPAEQRAPTAPQPVLTNLSKPAPNVEPPPVVPQRLSETPTLKRDPRVVPIAIPTPTWPPVIVNSACESSADCVISCVVPSDCCDQLCACTTAYSRRALAKELRWRASSCEQRTLRCPIAKCRLPDVSYVAVCERGHCVTQTQALVK